MVFASDFSCQGFLSSSMRVQASPDFYSGMTGFDTSHLQAGQSADIPTSLGVLLMLTSYFKLLLRNFVVFGHLRALMHLLHIVDHFLAGCNHHSTCKNLFPMPLIQLHIPLPHSVKQVCGTHFRWKSQVDLFFLMRVKPVTRFYHNVSSRRINIVFTRQAVAAEALELDPQFCSKARSEFQDSRSRFGSVGVQMISCCKSMVWKFHDFMILK